MLKLNNCFTTHDYNDCAQVQPVCEYRWMDSNSIGLKWLEINSAYSIHFASAIFSLPVRFNLFYWNALIRCAVCCLRAHSINVPVLCHLLIFSSTKKIPSFHFIKSELYWKSASTGSYIIYVESTMSQCEKNHMRKSVTSPPRVRSWIYLTASDNILLLFWP